MGFLSKLFGTDKKEKKLIKEMRLQITAGVSQLITEGYNKSNYFDWRGKWVDNLGRDESQKVVVNS